MPDQVAFVDVETTALDRDQLQVWEVALIVRWRGSHRPGDQEVLWHLPVDLSTADPMSLGMNGFVDRYADWNTPDLERPYMLRQFAQDFARLTRGLTLVGANPAFDERALWKLLRDNGECPLWHYRPICVETLAAGYLRAQIGVCGPPGSTEEKARERAVAALVVPWKHTDLVRALGINPDDFERHSALGDARLCKAVWERVMGR